MLLSFVVSWVVLTSPCWAITVEFGNTTLTGSIPSFHGTTFPKQELFAGIPFAEPPLGQLRLEPPVLKSRLNVSSFDASVYRADCYQPEIVGIPLPPRTSEDCLFINVLRPSGILPNASLPVFFWVYGGGFTTGSSVLISGPGIVQESIDRGTPLIFVSFNYRLGPLGFPQGREAGTKKALNLGLKDQLAALEWTNQNIGFFGGDPSKICVTVFGQSSGSIMTNILLINSRLEKYARAAIYESGHAASLPTYGPERREGAWRKFVAGVPSCLPMADSGETFDCLKSANTQDIRLGILEAFNNPSELFPYCATLDGPDGLYPDYPSKLLQDRFPNLPFIAGTNLDEGTIFAPKLLNLNDELRALIIANMTPPDVSPQELADAADKIVELYSDDPALGSPFNTGNNTFNLGLLYKKASAILGDVSFQSQRRIFQQAAAKSGVKSFGYLFARYEDKPTNRPFLGVGHGNELPFVFGIPVLSSEPLKKAIMGYWISFATSLDPNDGKGSPRLKWEPYTMNNQVLMQLNSTDNDTLLSCTVFSRS